MGRRPARNASKRKAPGEDDEDNDELMAAMDLDEEMKKQEVAKEKKRRRDAERMRKKRKAIDPGRKARRGQA